MSRFFFHSLSEQLSDRHMATSRSISVAWWAAPRLPPAAYYKPIASRDIAHLGNAFHLKSFSAMWFEVRMPMSKVEEQIKHHSPSVIISCFS